MKKTYEKPALYAERFAIAEHIASCLNVVQFGTECGPYVIDGLTLFTSYCEGDSAEFWEANDVGVNDANFEILKDRNMQCYTTYVNVDTIFVS